MNNLTNFIAEIKANVKDNILAFWEDKMFDPQGGFYGKMLVDGDIIKDAPRGAVLNARILWSFSAAYRILKDEKYLQMAKHAKDYLLKYIYDHENGGVFWSVTAQGEPLDTKKQFYALGFAVYALSEYYRITQDEEALSYALKLYDAIETHSFDRQHGGYVEAKSHEWQEMSDIRLSAKDANAPFSMNTHLHILEPYTNLYRVSPSLELADRLRALILIFTDRIYDPKTGHLGLFFDLGWNSLDGGFSYGHDIEASWLLLEAAQVLGDAALLEKVERITRHIAQASIEGVQADGSMIYECHEDGKLDTDRHWWVQAEAIVGFVWMAKFHQDQDAMSKAIACWDYIKANLVDPLGGEWWWSRDEHGVIQTKADKAGMWKCPYHNSRMAFEVIEQLSEHD